MERGRVVEVERERLVKAGGKNDPVRPTVLRGLVRNSLEKTSQTSHPS